MLLVPRARLELARAQGPRDFKSLVSTNSTTKAGWLFLTQLAQYCQLAKGTPDLFITLVRRLYE